MPWFRSNHKPKPKKRGSEQKTERIISVARRAGVWVGSITLILWLGSWLWISGLIQKGTYQAQQAAYELSADAGFAVDEIIVEGRENTSSGLLQALLNMERGDPILSFDPQEAREMLTNLSWVKDAHIERRLPGTIYISLHERQPMALWQNDGVVQLIDREGVVLAKDDLDGFRDLIIIVGEDAPRHAPELIDLLRVEPLIHEKADAAVWVSDRRWDLDLKSGIKVKLPEDDVGLALRRLAKAQEDNQILDKDITMVDLRKADRFIVRTRPGSVQDYKEE